jgi:hypothetical protein
MEHQHLIGQNSRQNQEKDKIHHHLMQNYDLNSAKKTQQRD